MWGWRAVKGYDNEDEDEDDERACGDGVLQVSQNDNGGVRGGRLLLQACGPCFKLLQASQKKAQCAHNQETAKLSKSTFFRDLDSLHNRNIRTKEIIFHSYTYMGYKVQNVR